MSQSEIIMIKCPRCGKEEPFQLWSSINTGFYPEMKEKVKNKSAFKFSCPNCGFKTFVYYGFLYHQMEDNLMIYCVESEEEAKKIKKTNLDLILYPNGKHDMFKNEYTLRIVHSHEELLEKLRILEDGFDDRYMELTKTKVIKFFHDIDKFNQVKTVDISFDALDEQFINFLVSTNGRKKNGFLIPVTTYDYIKKNFKEFIDKEKTSGFLEINQEWSNDIINRSGIYI